MSSIETSASDEIKEIKETVQNLRQKHALLATKKGVFNTTEEIKKSIEENTEEIETVKTDVLSNTSDLDFFNKIFKRILVDSDYNLFNQSFNVPYLFISNISVNDVSVNLGNDSSIIINSDKTAYFRYDGSGYSNITTDLVFVEESI